LGKDDSTIVLIPGFNNVPIEVAQYMAISPAVKQWTKAKWIEPIEVSAPRAREGVEPPQDLNGQSVPVALLAVKDEIDLDVLARWKAAERRAKVLEALDAKIADLSKVTPPAVPQP
jgi:hypothetical protein